MAKFCRKCGAPLKENAKFCNSCGAMIAEAGNNHSFNERIEKEEDKLIGVEDDVYADFADDEDVVYDKKKKGSRKLLLIILIILGIALIAAAAVFGIILLRNSSHNSDSASAPSSEVVKKDEDNSESSSQPEAQTNENNSQEEPEPTEEPVVTPEATEEPEPTPEPLVINEEYAAMQWYTYYISYLDAINHGGDISYLKNASAERQKSFSVNYEKYNKGFKFENISFDVDKTDMKLKDLGNGKIEATMHAYAVNVCTEIANGAVSDNKVTLLGVVQIDKETGDFILMQQQSDKDYTFGKHEMIRCVLG